MIVCHCTGISDGEIRSAIDWMRRADPHVLVTPGKVYRALGRRASCGDCMPLFLATMMASDGVAVPPVLRCFKTQPSEESLP